MDVELLIGRFRQYYGNDSMNDPRYLREEVHYKRERGKEMLKTLAEDVLHELIAQENYTEVCRRVVDAFSMSSGALARWDEYRWVRELEPDLQAALAPALFTFLYGADPFLSRLDLFAGEAIEIYRAARSRDADFGKRYKGRSPTWPFVSYFHFMMWPNPEERGEFVFVKPTPLNRAAQVAGYDLIYRSRPNAETYANVQEFYRQLWPAVHAMGGQTWVDVQTLIHVSGDGFGKPAGGWIDERETADEADSWRAKLEVWLEENPRTMPEELEKLRASFVERFPKEQLTDLTLKEYALGHEDSKDSFCYWLEWETEPLGSIRGGSVSKFGVWWDKESKTWQWNQALDASTPEKALGKLTEGLKRMVDVVEEGRWDQLDEIGAEALGPNRYSLRSKPLILYYPDELLPISNPGHLRHFLRVFDQEPEGDLHALNLQLLETLRELDEFEGFDPYAMGSFLYDCLITEDEVMPKRQERSLAKIQQHIAESPYTFTPDLVANYHLSLTTKPFVILTGLSGTGKTKLTKLYADAVYGIEVGDPNPYYQLVSVRPDWTDHRGLLGYYNPLMRMYEATPFLRFLLQAAADSEHKYYVCLDEMNLARVEYYFSDFLSALEAGETVHLHPHMGQAIATKAGNDIPPTIPIYQAAADYEQEGVLYVPDRIRIPPNLYVTGTVNVDETTHAFSDKVLDRANSIELNQVDLELYAEQYRKMYPERSNLLNDAMPLLQAVYDHLEPQYLHFGYRTVEEILNYLWHNESLPEEIRLPRAVAWDNQLMQKVLPKLRGDERIQETLEHLRAFLVEELGVDSRAVKKVDWMLQELEIFGSTHFWR